MAKAQEFKGFRAFCSTVLGRGQNMACETADIAQRMCRGTIEGTDGGLQRIDATHAEPNGYLAMAQGADGRIHLHSSRNDYVFNLAWLMQGMAQQP